MSKQKRGKYIKTLEGWRGTCPLCGKQRVKLVWSGKDSEGNNINICKLCSVNNTKK